MWLMRNKTKIKRKLDHYSPWPLFYPLVMTPKEKTLFDRKINKSKNYLEFGLGGSTLRALQKSRANIYSVESSQAWENEMRRYFLIRCSEKRRLTIHRVNIGNTRKWGYPESSNCRHMFPNYSASIFEKIDSHSIDFALVDGRFRIACTLKIILECHANNRLEIAIHDFWHRENYHLVLKYLNVVDRADSLGVFSIKGSIDKFKAIADYETYKFNPD